jgi:hypothetical protein
MPVGVNGDFDGAMPELVFDIRQALPALDEQGSVRMPQRMGLPVSDPSLM